jgi:hypothetical protein
MNDLIIEGNARAIASTFDYSQLNGDESKAARAARDRIRRRLTSQIEAIIETGVDLIQVKELLGHGRFTGWIEAEFGMSQRTATNYMRAADAFRGKTEIIADLPAATVYALAAAPPATRESIIEEIGSKAPPTEQQVKDALWTARQEQKRIAADAKLSARQRKSRAQQQAEHAAARQKQEREYQAAVAAAESAATIIAEGLSPEQAAKVGDLMSKARHHLREPLEAALLARAGQR